MALMTAHTSCRPPQRLRRVVPGLEVDPGI